MNTTNTPNVPGSSTDYDDLSDKQCQKLIAMLQYKLKSSSNTTLNSSWIQANTVSQMAGSFSQINDILAHNATVPVVNDSWIIDSGATHHITHNLASMIDVTTIQSEIHIPNGHSTSITHTGDINLSNNIILKQVLYAPSFNCILLYVAKFSEDN